jgi:hypothetical protein
MFRIAAFLLLVVVVDSAQQPATAPNSSLQEEIAFAESGGPAALARDATIYVLKDGKPIKAREGTNGCACIVLAWAPGDAEPTCYDPAATRVMLPRDLKEASLRAQGKSEGEITAEIGSAFVRGELQTPEKGALIYMTSPQGRLARHGKVVANEPHVMISVPYMKNADIGIFDLPGAKLQGVPYINHEGTVDAIIVADVIPSRHEGH